MKFLQFIIQAFYSVLFTSATPNLFGSRKRRKEKAALAGEFKKAAAETQDEIDVLKSQNPFESAAAKSALAESARRSKQMAQRYSNMMGANASPEALIAAQQASQEVAAGTTGDIAVGAEAQKQAQIAQLRGIKEGQMGQYGGIKTSSINERGSGWKDFFGSINQIGQAVSSVGEGASQIAGLF